MATVLSFPGNRYEPAEYDMSYQRECAICADYYNPEDEGYSEATCNGHARCTGQHGACRESGHPQAGTLCVYCNLEAMQAYLRDVQTERPEVITQEYLEEEQDALREIAKAEGLLQSYEEAVKYGQ